MSVLMRRRNQAQNLAWLQRPVGPQAAIALGDPAPPGPPHQAVSDQRIVDHEDDEGTQRRLRWEWDDLNITFDRQRGAHAGAAQGKPKDALSFERFPQQWEPRGCANDARPRLGAQARHAFTAAATCTACSLVRVSPDGR